MNSHFSIASVARWVESDIVNPIVTAVLRSPLHPLLSRWILLLSYEGRKSGRHYTTPVLYRETDRNIVLFTPMEHTSWWKNFRHERSLQLRIQGEWREGRGEAVFDEETVRAHLSWVVAPLQRTSLALWHRKLPTDERLRRSASAFVLVRVNPVDEAI